VDALYARNVAGARSVLDRSDYGRLMFLPAGRPVAQGSRLQLPAYADTLEHFGREGPAYFTEGEWGQDFLRVVNAAGGAVTAEELNAQHADVLDPIQWPHGEFNLYLGTGPSVGGAAKLVLASQLFADMGGPKQKPFTASWLEAQLWAFKGTIVETPWLTSHELPGSGEELMKASAGRASHARAVLAKSLPLVFDAPAPHSSAVVVVDRDGNIAAGMHTINTLPFGEGLFVRGVPLSTALSHAQVAPGQAVPERVSPVLALRDGVPVLALAQFGVGEFPADFAVLSAVLDAKLDVVEAAAGPRLAYFDVSPAAGTVLSQGLPPILVDPRYPRATLCALSAGGWPLNGRWDSYLSHTGFVDAVQMINVAGARRLRGVPAQLPLARAIGD
jgi:gamma-glutamyltranspeptidase / glutathione hydrolase